MYLHLTLDNWLSLDPLYTPEQGNLILENFEMLAAFDCFNASEFSLILFSYKRHFEGPFTLNIVKHFFVFFSLLYKNIG